MIKTNVNNENSKKKKKSIFRKKSLDMKKGIRSIQEIPLFSPEPKKTNVIKKDSATSDLVFSNPVVTRKKFIKATPPKPKSPEIIISPVEDDNEDIPESKRVFGTPPTNKDDQMRELINKKLEESLKNELKKNERLRMENIHQRRINTPVRNSERRNGTSSTGEDEKKTEDEIETFVHLAPITTQQNDMKIFSVQPLFPEHKRNNEEDSELPMKKIRLDESSSDESPLSDDNSINSFLNHLPLWVTIAIPVAAMASIFLVKSFRRN